MPRGPTSISPAGRGRCAGRSPPRSRVRIPSTGRGVGCQSVSADHSTSRIVANVGAVRQHDHRARNQHLPPVGPGAEPDHHFPWRHLVGVAVDPTGPTIDGRHGEADVLDVGVVPRGTRFGAVHPAPATTARSGETCDHRWHRGRSAQPHHRCAAGRRAGGLSRTASVPCVRDAGTLATASPRGLRRRSPSAPSRPGRARRSRPHPAPSPQLRPALRSP